MKYCDACHTTYPKQYTTCPKDQSGLRETAELVEGMILKDKYEVLERIGAGGMAAVYRARHLAFGEIRAIKVVGNRFADDEDLLKRFRTEAVVTRKLQHPNAVRVDDLDATEDGRPFIVMEYVDGESLRSVLKQAGCLPGPRALAIARQAADALGAAHTLGIVHRDIKPENILLVARGDGSDFVKVVDFGIAKVREGALDVGEGYTPTETGVVVGTPQYLSPEQAMGKRGDEVDGRADLYSLGLVLYETLTGQLPFRGDTGVQMLLHQVQTAPTPPHLARPDLGIPAAVSALLMRALAKDRARRFQTAEEMGRALDALAKAPAPLRPGASARPAGRDRPDLVPTRAVRASTSRPGPEPGGGQGRSLTVAAVVIVLLGLAAIALRHRNPAVATPQEVGALPASAPESSPAALAPPATGPLAVAPPPTWEAAAPATTETLPPATAQAAPPATAEPVPASTPSIEPPPPGPRRGEGDDRIGRLLAEGRQAMARGDADAAIAAFRGVLDLDPTNPLARMGLRRAEDMKHGRPGPPGPRRPRP